MGLAVAGVAKDGEDLDTRDVSAPEPVQKLGLIANLEREERRGRNITSPLLTGSKGNISRVV